MSDTKGLLGRLFGGRRAEQEAEPHQDEIQADTPALDDDVRDVASDNGDVVDAPESPKKSWLARLTAGLAKTRASFMRGLTGLFTGAQVDADILQDFEDLLLQTDLGLPATERLIGAVEAHAKAEGALSAADVRQILETQLVGLLAPVAQPLDIHRKGDGSPTVVLVVGVNGTGKTTTIGKLTEVFRRQKLNVVLSASDTFRAAAREQLGVWASRTGAELVAREEGADPAGVAYDAIDRAQNSGGDVVIVDTAGRLQNKAELMDELRKIRRVIEKKLPGAPHHVILTLDATTGQNAINQVEVFRDVAGVTGLVMTKLDGTARGGILVAVAERFGLPIHYIGVGESLADLEPFDAQEFVTAFLDG